MKICTACFTSSGKKKVYCKKIFGLSQNNSVAFCLLWQKKKKNAFNDQSFFCTKWKIMLPLNTSFE